MLQIEKSIQIHFGVKEQRVLILFHNYEPNLGFGVLVVSSERNVC
jgi:hypothetical protein